jgi:hypothetical protein
MLLTTILSLATTALALPMEKRKPANAWSATVSGYTPVPNTAGNPAYHVFPDGHLSSLPSASGGWQMYWSNAENYRSIGSGPHAEEQTQIEPAVPYPNIYFGGRTGKPGFDNGGKWLSSVHASPDGNPSHLVAFYHAEDGYWPYQGAGNAAWTSIGLAHSFDNGQTWKDYGQILTSAGRPSDEEGIANQVHGGIGNHGCIYHNSVWTCIFSSNPDHTFGIAVSYDAFARPGTWKKLLNGKLSGEGLGGDYSTLPGLKPGLTPSIMFNKEIDQYIMAYGTWEDGIHIASSSDLVNWTGDRLLVKPTFGQRAWYPSLISSEGSYIGGGDLSIYYADGLSPGGDVRQLTKMNLKIDRL